MTRVRGKRQAEREAHEINNELLWRERLERARTTGPYHEVGIESFATQWVCHLCQALVFNRDKHTAWHNAMGQELPS